MVQLEIRNPVDLLVSFNQIEIERGALADGSDMSLITTVSIDTTTASDLSTGYTTYIDEAGVLGTTYYRFRYKNSVSVATSAYSDVFLSGTTVLHNRFRNRMRDTNSNNYFFTNSDIDSFVTEAVEELWPITWFETYSDGGFVPDNTTEIFNFPTGVTRVNGIDFLDSSGNDLGKVVNWDVRGRVVIFDSAPITGYTLRIWVEKMFTKLAEVPEIWDGYILNKMRLKAYETLEANRTSYYKYVSVAKPEGGNLPSLNGIITRIEAQIQRREAQLRRVRKPAFIKLV